MNRTKQALATISTALVLSLTPSCINADAQTMPSTCRDFAVALNKEGRVRDSVHMHLIGCDDVQSPTYYHATTTPANALANRCTTRARAYARAGYYAYPNTVARLVKNDLPFCIVFEDGSYGTDDAPKYTEAD